MAFHPIPQAPAAHRLFSAFIKPCSASHPGNPLADPGHQTQNNPGGCLHTVEALSGHVWPSFFCRVVGAGCPHPQLPVTNHYHTDWLGCGLCPPRLHSTFASQEAESLQSTTGRQWLNNSEPTMQTQGFHTLFQLFIMKIFKYIKLKTITKSTRVPST